MVPWWDGAMVGTPGNSSAVPATRSPTPRMSSFVCTLSPLKTYGRQGRQPINTKLNDPNLKSQGKEAGPSPRESSSEDLVSQPTGPASRDVTVGPALESSLRLGALGLSGKWCQRKLQKCLWYKWLFKSAPSFTRIHFWRFPDFSILAPKALRGARAQGNLGEATLETRGEILGWTDTGGKWMWAHRLTQTLGLCPQGKVSLSFSNSRVLKNISGR